MPFRGEEITVPDVSLHEFSWQACLKRGDEIFMVDNTTAGRFLTYTDVHEQSRRCAAYLHKDGLKVGDFVGLCAPSCLEYVIAMYGIMGCGATVTPCNPAYTEGEILQQFRISEPNAVIVHESALETIKKVKTNLSCLKTIYVIGKSSEFTTLETILKSDCDLKCLENIKINPSEDIAMLPYSSGTTGLPKCVMMTHRNLVSMVTINVRNSEWFSGENPVGYMDRPMYHGGGFGSVLFCLANGMKLIIEKEFVVDTMLKAIEKYKLTHLITVPPIMIELVNADNSITFDTSSLRVIYGTGAAMAPKTLQRLIDKFHVDVIVGYGMTEAGMIATCRDPKTPLESCGSVSVGVEMKIINSDTEEECDVGVDGEIVARSPQTMKGYLKNPEVTAKTLGKDGWIHTGDIGHVDKNGYLYVVDRIKEVIKYRSLQVPPAELESVILEHPKVADVGVIGIPDPDAGEIPKAFVVKKDDSLNKEEIIEHVKSRLADYKHLRGGVKFVEAIPKSPTGKIQRKELKKMAGLIV